MKIRKGDSVMVITGKEKGKIGKVLVAYPKENKVIIEGLNKVKRHLRGDPRRGIPGGIITKEAPIHVSNVMLICSNCKLPTRVGYVISKEGEKIRLCRKCQGEIPYPPVKT
jgi:large subunit ribosomal protein L24